MNYLDKIKQETLIKEKYDKDTLRIKMAIVKINSLHDAFNGDFIDDLEEFLKNYKEND